MRTIYSFGFALFALTASTGCAAPSADAGEEVASTESALAATNQLLFRMYNGASYDHALTSSAAEYTGTPGYTPEQTMGRCWSAGTPGTTKLYRLWNGEAHLYTIQSGEVYNAEGAGYGEETAPCAVLPSWSPGACGVYRYHHPHNVIPGNEDYLYTLSRNEGTAAARNGYVMENGGNPVFYVMPFGTTTCPL